MAAVTSTPSKRSCEKAQRKTIGNGNSVSLVHALFDHESAHVRLLALVLFCKLVVLSLDYKLLPDIPRASRYYNKVYGSTAGSVEVQTSSEPAERDIRITQTVLPGSQSNADGHKEAPTFSDTFEALGIGPQQFMSVLLFVQERLSKSQSGDSPPKRSLQNKIIVQALQMAMCGEFCGHLLPIIAEAFGGSPLQEEQDLQLTGGRLAAIDASLDSSFSEFQTHRLPSAIVCVPMAFLSLLYFATSEDMTLELRLVIVLNLKTAISRSVANCDRLLAIGHWQEYLLLLIAAESTRRAAVPADVDDSASGRLLSKSMAVGDACVWMLCEIQTTAMKVGRSTEALGISRHASTTKELTRPEVMRCITRGDRVLGGVVLRESVERLVAVIADPFLMRATGTSVLAKAVRCLVLEWSTLHPAAQPDTVSGPPDLMLDHCDKMVHLNAWLVAVATLELDDLLKAAPEDERISSTETAAEAAPSLWTVAEQLVGLLRSFGGAGVSRWMMEEKSFRVRAGTSAPSPPKLSHSASYSLGGSPNSAKLTSTQHPVPLSHAAGGLCSLAVRLCCRVHLSDDAPGNTDVTAQLRELLESCAPFSEVYEREAIYVLAQLSEALRTTGIGLGHAHSDRWVVASIELLVELAVAVRDPLLSMVADGSYNRSFNALSESAFPSSEEEFDRSTSGEASRDPSMNSVAAAPVPLDSSNSHILFASSPSYLVLIKSLVPVVELPGDDESAAELWSHLMAKHIGATSTTDRHLATFRLAELGLKPFAAQPQHVADRSSSFKRQWMTSNTIAKPQDCLMDSRAWRSSCLDLQTARLRELIRTMDSQNRRLEAKWSRIFTELANERGPWGYSATGD